MSKLTAALILVLGAAQRPQDPPKPSLVESIDSAVTGLPGYNPQRVGVILGDADFLKRLTRDLTGADPSDAELREFAANNDPKKRELKVVQLTDSPKFAEFWARRLAAVLFEGRETLTVEVSPTIASQVGTPLVKNLVAWLQAEIAKDRPYTEIVSDLLDARGSASESPAVAYKLALRKGPDPALSFAMGMSRQLLGIRFQCARCHDHPFDGWTVENFYSLAAFDVRAAVRGIGPREDHDYEDVSLKYSDEGEMKIPHEEGGRKGVNVKLADGGVAKPVSPFGGSPGPNDDRMKVLAGLVTGKGGNHQLARAMANRIWAWLLGRGVVHPVDDFNKRTLREANNPLLETLTRGLIDNKFSIKALVRSICSTTIYQRADVTPPGEGVEVYWHGALARTVTKPKPVPLPKDLMSLDVPPSWVSVYRPAGCKAQFSVPDKEKKARDAEVGLYRATSAKEAKRQIEDWTRQWVVEKTVSDSADVGRGKVTYHDFAGTYTCDRYAEDTGKDRTLVAVVEVGGETWVFRFLGRAQTVDGWRREFLDLLKSATK